MISNNATAARALDSWRQSDLYPAGNERHG
jgi:hypothetical protein